MLRFHADKFLATFNSLYSIRVLANQSFNLVDQDGSVRKQLHHLSRQFLELEMKLSSNAALLLAENIRPDVPMALKGTLFSDLVNRVMEELKSVWLVSIPASMAVLYRKTEPFGRAVIMAFPEARDDIEEAGKCLALDRSTACVFHLGRALELGVHSFASALGCKLSSDRNWQTFINAINDAVSKLPTATEGERSKKSEYSQAASNLYLVKLSWRNNTMHPKSKYSCEEATEVYSHVKTFMRHLSDLSRVSTVTV